MHDDIADDLAEARARLEAAREAVRPLLDASGADRADVRRFAARLDRMAAEVARIEGVVEGLAVAAGERSAWRNDLPPLPCVAIFPGPPAGRPGPIDDQVQPGRNDP